MFKMLVTSWKRVNQSKLYLRTKDSYLIVFKNTNNSSNCKIQGSYRSWKTWKVLEYYYGIFQDWKVLEKGHWSWKVLEICLSQLKDMCMIGSKKN